jgi:serine/threonine-protein kinase
LASLLDELAKRSMRDEAIDIDAECGKHPEFGHELLELWSTILFANAVARDSSQSHGQAAGGQTGWQATGSEFRDAREGSDGLSGSSSQTGEHESAFELPHRFGDYELIEELGRGGMGVVYRARQLSLGRDVSIKMLLRGQFATDADHARFRAEAEAAGRLDHPNIVPVYDVGAHQGHPFFSMKLIEGETLARRLNRQPLSSREAARLMATVARAIEVAHQRGVLHRDLKPSNILIDHSGTPHITDFGLAKNVADASSLTRSGAVLGTPAYMAPEQAAGNRGAVGVASDVYSLGSIMYHILAGRPPFVADSPLDVVLQVLEQDPPLPRNFNSKVDRDLEMIVLRCLQKPPDLRYSTAADLANDLEAYLADEPLAVRSGRLSQVVSRMFRETHHATILENWGLLWMWHSLALIVVCFMTNGLHLYGVASRLPYVLLWTAGLGTWAAVFWALRRRMGPVTFIERQIAHLWAASMVSIGLLFPVEYVLGLPVLTLSPVLGLISGTVFLAKAGVLSGAFYFSAVSLYASAIVMAQWPKFAHVIFGIASAACFFLHGLKYHRQNTRRRAVLASPVLGSEHSGRSS